MEQHIAHRVRRHDGRLIVGEKRGNTLRKSPSRGREKGAQGTEKKGNKEGKRHATTTDHRSSPSSTSAENSKDHEQKTKRDQSVT